MSLSWCWSRLVGFVDGDEPLLEDLDGLTQSLLEVLEARLRAIELRLLLPKLSGDDRRAVP
jgi:hypothetical protein